MRRDLQPPQDWDEVAVEVKILTGRRYDLAADRTLAIDRMRVQLLKYFPALEQVAQMPIDMGRPFRNGQAVAVALLPAPNSGTSSTPTSEWMRLGGSWVLLPSGAVGTRG